jgi:S-adenosylmethionine:tRNA ribosyltransferase-isomerase
MLAARSPRSDKMKVRLLVSDPDGRLQDSSIESLPDFLEPGDLVVVNDAATLPASLQGWDGQGNRLEIRLMSQLDDRVWRAVTFGAGDWRIPTEDRPQPPRLREGEKIGFSREFNATVLRQSRLSERLLELEFNLEGEDLWRAIYSHGKPIQYSYMNEGLELWSVQNVYSSRPWAVEMPSAGHALSWQILMKLAEKGVRVVALTHGAGLSSTGDTEIDRALPLAERFEIPATTMEAVRTTRNAGGRVVAAGTSVVRALESSKYGLSGFTDLKIGPGHRLEHVDALLTGTHDVAESHYQLLGAFVPTRVLIRINGHLEAQGYLTHEFGDLCLVSATPMGEFRQSAYHHPTTNPDRSLAI